MSIKYQKSKKISIGFFLGGKRDGTSIFYEGDRMDLRNYSKGKIVKYYSRNDEE